MYLMFGDEADPERGRRQKFFVCGAVFINAQQVDAFLKERGDVGIVLMDRSPSQLKDAFKYLKNKFQIGLQFPSGGNRRVDNIIVRRGIASCVVSRHPARVVSPLCKRARQRHRKCCDIPDTRKDHVVPQNKGRKEASAGIRTDAAAGDDKS